MPKAKGDNNPAANDDLVYDDTNDVPVIKKEESDNKDEKVKDDKEVKENQSDNKDDAPQEDYKKMIEGLQRRYESSSEEGKKLNQRLRDTETKLKTVEETNLMLQDLLEDLIKKEDAKEESEKELKLPEDFIFDINDAISNPNSQSGKVLDTLLEKKLNSKIKSERESITKEREKERKEDNYNREKEDLMRKYGLTEDDMKIFEEELKNTPASLELYYKALHGDKIATKKEKNEIEEKIEQYLKTKKLHASPDIKDTSSDEKSDRQALFDVIRKQVDPLSNINITE